MYCEITESCIEVPGWRVDGWECPAPRDKVSFLGQRHFVAGVSVDTESFRKIIIPTVYSSMEKLHQNWYIVMLLS